MFVLMDAVVRHYLTFDRQDSTEILDARAVHTEMLTGQKETSHTSRACGADGGAMAARLNLSGGSREPSSRGSSASCGSLGRRTCARSGRASPSLSPTRRS